MQSQINKVYKSMQHFCELRYQCTILFSISFSEIFYVV